MKGIVASRKLSSKTGIRSGKIAVRDHCRATGNHVTISLTPFCSNKASLDLEKLFIEFEPINTKTLAVDTMPSVADGDCQISMERDTSSNPLQPDPTYFNCLSDQDYTDNEHNTDEDVSEELEEDSDMDEDMSSRILIHKHRLTQVTEVEEGEEEDEEPTSTDESDLSDDEDKEEEEMESDEVESVKHNGFGPSDGKVNYWRTETVSYGSRGSREHVLSSVTLHNSRGKVNHVKNRDLSMKWNGLQTENRFLRLEKMRSDLEQDLGVEPLLRAYNIIQVSISDFIQLDV